MLNSEIFSDDVDLLTKEKGVAVVIRIGERRFDTNNYIEKKKQVDSLLEHKFNLIIIDLQNCEIITEDGRGILLYFYKEATKYRCHVVLCGLQPNVQEYLGEFDKIFKICTDSEGALKNYLATRGENKHEHNTSAIANSQKLNLDSNTHIYLYAPWVAAGLLIIAIIPGLPYGYYTLLRWVVFLTACYGAYVTIKASQHKWWIFIPIAILFNPIVPIPLAREIWAPIDVTCAVLLLALRKVFHS